jgi:hypothetical protein
MAEKTFVVAESDLIQLYCQMVHMADPLLPRIIPDWPSALPVIEIRDDGRVLVDSAETDTVVLKGLAND